MQDRNYYRVWPGELKTARRTKARAGAYWLAPVSLAGEGARMKAPL
jgi:hypothetical protein